MKYFYLTFLCALCLLLQAQTTTTFESFGLSEGQFLNGSTLPTPQSSFEVDNAFLSNDYNAGYNSWQGWAISATTDVTTPGFTNQFSAITGGGYDGSTTYATSYAFNPSIIQLRGAAAGGVVNGFYITNATYAYLSMLNGDSPPGKRFGGEDGNDPDYLLLSIQAYYNGTLNTQPVEFYLADYRFDNNNEDYIVDDWTYVDLTILGNVDSLLFTLSSSDTGQFGLNTPSYFCIDNFTTADVMTNTDEVLAAPSIKVYPNPTMNILYVTIPPLVDDYSWQIYTSQGQLVKTGRLLANTSMIDVVTLPKGMYHLQFISPLGQSVQSFVKQ